MIRSSIGCCPIPFLLHCSQPPARQARNHYSEYKRRCKHCVPEDANSLDRVGTTRLLNSSLLKLLPMDSRGPTAEGGAPVCMHVCMRVYVCVCVCVCVLVVWLVGWLVGGWVSRQHM
jgi:hypothetical protein